MRERVGSRPLFTDPNCCDAHAVWTPGLGNRLQSGLLAFHKEPVLDFWCWKASPVWTLVRSSQYDYLLLLLFPSALRLRHPLDLAVTTLSSGSKSSRSLPLPFLVGELPLLLFTSSRMSNSGGSRSACHAGTSQVLDLAPVTAQLEQQFGLFC